MGDIRHLITLPNGLTLKSVTIGVMVQASGITLGHLAVIYFWNARKPLVMGRYIFTIIPIVAEILYIEKEQSFTFPFIRDILEASLRFLTCQRTPVGRFTESECDPRHVPISRISGGHVFRVPDDGGGIYMRSPVIPNVPHT